MSHRAATWIAFGAICRRSLTTLTAARNSPRHQLSGYRLPGHSYLASQATRGRKLPKNHFTANRALRQDTPPEPPKKESKRKNARSKAASTSLRRVAVEAQQSRDGLVRGKGRKRHLDPVAETKEVTAYCAAETYQVSAARRLLMQEGFRPDPLKTDLYPQVLHVQTPNFVSQDPETGEKREQGIGDVFVFPSGSVVTWNVPEHIGNNIVTRIIRPAAENPHQVEVEDFEYLEDSTRDASVIVGDTIVLGTKTAERLPPATAIHRIYVCDRRRLPTSARNRHHPRKNRLLLRPRAVHQTRRPRRSARSLLPKHTANPHHPIRRLTSTLHATVHLTKNRRAAQHPRATQPLLRAHRLPARPVLGLATQSRFGKLLRESGQSSGRGCAN